MSSKSHSCELYVLQFEPGGCKATGQLYNHLLDGKQGNCPKGENQVEETCLMNIGQSMTISERYWFKTRPTDRKKVAFSSCDASDQMVGS
jgi:hypothetical protein